MICSGAGVSAAAPVSLRRRRCLCGGAGVSAAAPVSLYRRRCLCSGTGVSSRLPVDDRGRAHGTTDIISGEHGDACVGCGFDANAGKRLWKWASLGDCLSENTGLRRLSLAWNSIRGRGAVLLARGLGANIFLRALDLSFNGFGMEGSAALGEALKDNNTLEDLNISNNRLPPAAALLLAAGLAVNKTLKSLNMGRNPIHSAGCYAVLKSLQGNPRSGLETLGFAHIVVNQDFEDLYATVKEILPALVVNHGGKTGTFRIKQK
ncbi:hypothetical protein CRUP_021503 [Coryphaenoides rupestris]|nr:hypothetical protein CRUP_021503 [Coryphaenoides rupestris]